VIDEAYVDFVGPELGHDVVGLIAERDNLLVLRTLSEGDSLAGLRFGYGLGAAPLLWKTRDSYNVDAIAQRLATAALAARDQAAETWRRVRSERARVSAMLRQLGFALATESQSNFVLAPCRHMPRRPTSSRRWSRYRQTVHDAEATRAVPDLDSDTAG
jgi:histidinol-phosphate aminotransferase